MDQQLSSKKSFHNNDPLQSPMTNKELQIEQNNKKYFEKKLNDRRKRTYDILS